MCHGLPAHAISSDTRPKFISFCVKGIHKKLKEYLKPSKLLMLMGLDVDDKEKKNLKKTLLRLIYDITSLRI